VGPRRRGRSISWKYRWNRERAYEREFPPVTLLELLLRVRDKNPAIDQRYEWMPQESER